MFPRYLKTIPAAILVLSVLSACGPSRPQTAPVTGKVTFRGNPLPEGTITFYPEIGRSATGRIGPDGTYVLTTFDEGDGALVGKHTVTIEAVRFAQRQQPKSLEEEIAMARSGKKEDPAAAKPQRLVPQKYAEKSTSGLSAEVSSGKNSIDFDLSE